jgi:hypothetical protein
MGKRVSRPLGEYGRENRGKIGGETVPEQNVGMPGAFRDGFFFHTPTPTDDLEAPQSYPRQYLFVELTKLSWVNVEGPCEE